MKIVFGSILFLSLWSELAVRADSSARLDSSLYKISVHSANNLSELKLLAERGLADAQIKVAKACADSQLYADALKWYSAAAKQGVIEANFQKGHMLLYGCRDAPPNQCVKPDPTAALSCLFMAATNGHFGASYDVAVSLKDGLGCPADLVSAYAWFSLCADHGSDPSRTAMNWLALRLSGSEIRQALTLARETKMGHWPGMSLSASGHPVAAVDINLKLSGVVFSPRGNMAIINKRTLAEGETIQLKTGKNEMVDVTCVSVQPSFVQVKVESEADLRTLTAAR